MTSLVPGLLQDPETLLGLLAQMMQCMQGVFQGFYRSNCRSSASKKTPEFEEEHLHGSCQLARSSSVPVLMCPTVLPHCGTSSLPDECCKYACMKCHAVIMGLPFCDEGLDDLPLHFGCCDQRMQLSRFEPPAGSTAQDVKRTAQFAAAAASQHARRVRTAEHVERWQKSRLRKK
jgi:hypothetical protein